jgi:histidinol-phosphatase (PHP family)
VERTTVNRPDILGHFDLIRKFGSVKEEDPRYRAMATDAMLACLEVTPIVELNMNPLTRRYRATPYPHSFLLKEILEHKGHVMVCSDAHRTDQLGGCFEQGVDWLRQHGFRSVVMLSGGRFKEFGI